MKTGQHCRFLRKIGAVLATALALGSLGCSANKLPIEKIELPPGFTINLYSDQVPGARSLTLGARGTVFVGSREAGKVYALRDTDHDGRADDVFTLARGLNSPNGVATRDGDLYVAEIHRILRYPNIQSHLQDPPEPELVTDAYPTDAHHGWRFIAFGPDGRLYVPVGAPCNICNEPGYALMTSLKPDGSDKQVYARGIRNTVGFDWHPETGVLWFTDNGRDWLGDNRPPDELNRAPRSGMHFGYPFCHGGDIPDPEFGAQRGCDEFTPPAKKLGPHVAALGMRFYTGDRFPPQYRHQILLAEHGSWNRSRKIGYRVMLVRVEDGEAVSYEPFATGWLQGENDWGRPVDVQVMPDGALLVSDDANGVIYRIQYTGE